MNDFMELRRVTTIILRRWWLLLLLVVLGAVAGYAISRAQTPVYQATTTVLVGESIRSSSVDRVDIQISEALIQTYVEIARRQPVLQGVVTALNLNKSWQELSRQVTVSHIDGTQIIEIVVEADSPELARSIADEMVNQLILLSPSSTESAENQFTSSFNRDQITSLQARIVNGQNRLAEIETALNSSISESQLAALQAEKTNLEGLVVEWERNYTQLLALTEPRRDPTQLSIIEPAHSNARMVRPRIQLNTIVGAGVGMVLALGLIFLMDFLDDTFRSLKDVSQSEDVNILGSIRRIRGRRLSDKIIAHLQPHSPITESYRIIRSRIRFNEGDNPAQAIMVTSPMPREGKSLTAANLAVVFAQADFKTVIVDAALRHPVLHEVFNVQNEIGLADVLNSDTVQVEDCLKDTSVDNLQILTAGKDLPDPSWQLGAERMQEIIMELKKVADFVIFDSPPVLAFADAVALSRRMDGVIVVIRAGKTKQSALDQTLFDLQNANAHLLGSIFNQSPNSDSFSMNKVYVPERSRLSFARPLPRQEDQPGALRAAAMPVRQNHKVREAADVRSSDVRTINHGGDRTATTVNENLETSGREIETAGLDKRQFLDRDTVTSDDETQEFPVFDNGFKAPEIPSADNMEAVSPNHQELAEFPDLPSSDGMQALIDENEFSEQEEAIPVIEHSEMTNLEAAEAEIPKTEDRGDFDLIAGETIESEPLSSEASLHESELERQSKKKRRRKSKHTELNSEGTSMGPDDPVEPTNEQTTFE